MNMKIKSILFIFTLMLSLGMNAQEKLQFSKVVFYDLAASASQEVRVPPGKVWKIESAGGGSVSSPATIFLRNSSSVNVTFFSGIAGSPNSAAYPFWLPMGFIGSFYNGSAFNAAISIVEYNVVQ